MTHSSQHSAGRRDGQDLGPGDVVDRYEILTVIGRGGTATVYKVRHRDLGTIHALKVLSLLSPSIKRRTLQEGRLQATLRHRNVVGVYDVLDVDGAPGLLMELVRGPSLETALARHRFTLAHAELIFRGILAGVQAAHEHELALVHRDLKPANVLLAETRQGLVPKVTDFGIAKALDEVDDGGHTRAGVAMGTPQYMAPEQIRDARSVDQRADIFSLGCILYELVSGQRAFPQDDILKVYNAVCDGQIAPLHTLVADVPPRIAVAVEGCLSVDREARITDCATLFEVLDGLRSWSTEDPTEVVLPPDGMAPPDAESLDSFLPSDLLSELADTGDDVGAIDLSTTAAPADGTLSPEEASGVHAVVPGAAVVPRTAHDAPEQRARRFGMAAIILALLGMAVLTATWMTRTPAPEPLPVAPVVEVAPAEEEVAAEAAVDEAPDVEPAAAPPTVVDVAPAAAQRPAATPARPEPVQAAPAKAEAAKVAPPTPAAPAATPVTARLLSLPRTATLTLDGKTVGVTPHKVDLMPGAHTVVLRNAELEGRFTIKVTASGANKWCFLLAEGTALEGSCPR